MPPKEGGIAFAAVGADPKHARSFCAEAKPKKINEIKNRVSKDQFTVEYQWVRRAQSVAATRPLIIGLPAREPAQESEGANAGDARTNQGEGPHARSNHFLRRASLGVSSQGAVECGATLCNSAIMASVSSSTRAVLRSPSGLPCT